MNLKQYNDYPTWMKSDLSKCNCGSPVVLFYGEHGNYIIECVACGEKMRRQANDMMQAKYIWNQYLLKKETVNHPQHYNITGRKECIEEMIDIYGIDAVITFCMLNSYKYRYRHELKNGAEDLQKAEWYDAKALSLTEIKNNQSNK